MPNRIEREIEEILTRLDEFVPEESRARKMRRRARLRFGSVFGSAGDWLRARTRGMNGGHVVLGAAGLLLLAFILRGTFPTFARWATYIGIAVFFGAIFLSIKPLHRRPSQPYWRGQPLELRRPGPLMRLRMWWRRRNGRRF